jgi:hypothetical protein
VLPSQDDLAERLFQLWKAARPLVLLEIERDQPIRLDLPA